MRRRNGEKLSLFRHELPLAGVTAEAAPWELPEISAALPEPWAPTGTEADLGA
jgi:hypothetical protein